MSNDKTNFFVIGRVTFKSDVDSTPHGPRQTMYLNVLKTNHQDFADTRIVRVTAWKDVTSKLVRIRKTNLAMIIFQDFKDTGSEKGPSKAIRATDVIKQTIHDFHRYCTDQNGLYDPVNRYVNCHIN